MSSMWHYTRNGETIGPISGDQLQGLVDRGQLDLKDLVWREGMAGWATAELSLG